MLMGRTLSIDPLTRLEGHGRIEIHLDESGEVDRAYLQVPELRGFERFCLGRKAEEMPFIVSRLCGICPAAHHLASAKALDALYQAPPPPAARLLRELMYMAHFYHSHLAHWFILAGPDLFLHPDAPAAERNVLGVAQKLGLDLAKEVLGLRLMAQEAQALLGGRAIHMAWCVPGGVSRGLDSAGQKQLIIWGQKAQAFALRALEIYKHQVWEQPSHQELMQSQAFQLPVHDMGTVDAQGCVALVEGRIRVQSSLGRELACFEPKDYASHIQERSVDHSYMKMPALKAFPWQGLRLGDDQGIYRATPLSRLNVATGMSTPLAHKAWQDFYAALGQKPVHATMAHHWARLVELLHVAERWLQLAQDPLAVSPMLRTLPSGQPGEGVGSVEAPRGTLFHHYACDSQGCLTSVNLIVGTTHNHAAMALSITQAAKGLIRKGEAVTEGMLNRLEMAFRAYDPCLSCATHSLPGQMPMVVTVRDAQGAVCGYAQR
jgi:F420-non-reducing hydrogenase large subunit